MLNVMGVKFDCWIDVSLVSILMNVLFLIAGEVQCEQPNNSLYTFTGNLIIDKQTLPLTPNEIMLRVWYVIYFSYFYLFFFWQLWIYFRMWFW